MRFAYADPPYLGYASFYDHPETHVWDLPETHQMFIGALSDWFPDGWALSLTSTNLKQILPMCPPDVRVMAWVKPFASFKKGVNPAYAWEPLVLRGGRRRTDGQERTVRDWTAANITLRKGLVGAKPPDFCRWVLDVLGYRRSEDEIVDLFPGTGVMGQVAGSTPINEGLFAIAQLEVP